MMEGLKHSANMLLRRQMGSWADNARLDLVYRIWPFTSSEQCLRQTAMVQKSERRIPSRGETQNLGFSYGLMDFL